jgi:hypothetical protein
MKQLDLFINLSLANALLQQNNHRLVVHHFTLDWLLHFLTV